MNITFLTLDDVNEIHVDQIQRYGGSPGVRDLGMLQSAIATPQAAFGGQCLHEFPHEMAAAYLFHLVQNHPFVDGNKRVGLASSLTFLRINRRGLQASKQEVEQLVLGVASGTIGKSEVVEFFRKHVVR